MMSAAEASNMNKSITRLLQHSILQLCNEHIGYTHKLQILGVLCMTVDDEQQELVVKVNNTLKRVSPSLPKDPPSHLTPLSHVGGFESREVPTYSIQPSQSQHTSCSQNSPTEHNGKHASSPAAGEMAAASGRKSHGRKGNNPVKVHQVYDEAEPTSDDEEEPITVIPEAPEATLAFPDPADSPAAGASSPNPQRLLASDKSAGSAKRKPSQQFRVPQYFNSPSSSPYQGQSRPDSAGGSPYSTQADNSSKAPENGTSTPKPGKGLSLPIYIAGNYYNNHTENFSADDNSSVGEMPGMNGNHVGGESPCNGLNLSMASKASRLKVKEEPNDEDYKAMDLSNTDDAFKNAARLFNSSLLKNSSLLHSGDGLPTQVPFAMLGSALLGSGLPLGAQFMPDPDGLSIKYTNTGPYTVGANGKDVSNSSRIKDIIMYDELSPLNQQIGAKIETDFIVDTLGMDGRKRRRRAPEDQLTQEEVAEYLGQEAETYSFKCKYCVDEFESVTRYIHHTLLAHQSYICHQCGKSFTTKSSLLRHRPIHTGMRRFACSICQKTFYRKDKCKAHIKRHLGLDGNDKPVYEPEKTLFEPEKPLSEPEKPDSKQDTSVFAEQPGVFAEQPGVFAEQPGVKVE